MMEMLGVLYRIKKWSVLPLNNLPLTHLVCSVMSNINYKKFTNPTEKHKKINIHLAHSRHCLCVYFMQLHLIFNIQFDLTLAGVHKGGNIGNLSKGMALFFPGTNMGMSLESKFHHFNVFKIFLP